MPTDTLTKGSLSPAYDASARDLERLLTKAEKDAIQWQNVEGDPLLPTVFRPQ